jgi:hypothetical protein
MTKLIPNNLITAIPNLYSTEDEEDPICHIKLFTPDANWTWFITELSIDDNDTCFGYVVGLERELGYFSLSEIEAIRGHLGLPVERDLGFTPTRLSEVKSIH